MSTETTMTNIYDIAMAFITDRDTNINVSGNGKSLNYKFINRGLADYPYCLEITIPRGAPERLGWPLPLATNKKQGIVHLHRGTATTDIYHERTLLSATTKHNVGRAHDPKQSDLMRFITRSMSPRFFKLVNMANQRTRCEIQTTDNTAMLYNMIYRIKQK